MNESKVVRYEPSLEWLCIEYEDPRQVVEMNEDSDGTYVTHADYRALEEDRDELQATYDAFLKRYENTVMELAALRGKIGSIEKKDTDTCNREWANGWNSCRLALEALK